jgi:hypothetical protein
MTDADDESPAALAGRISGADRPDSASPSEDAPPNAALNPVGMLLCPYRRVLLPVILLAIVVLVIVSLAT